MEWWQRTHRIADVAFPAWSDETAQVAVRTHRDLAFDVDQVAALELRGGQRGVFYFKTKAAEAVDHDYLASYLEEARTAGIRVVASLNVHWLETGFAARHRDWLQLRPDGGLIDDVHGKGAAACPNSPGFRAWSHQIIRDLARYPVDGIQLQGPAFRPTGCWCASCAARFQEKLGKGLPARENWEDAAWKEFVEFRYESVAEYIEQARAAIRKSRTEAVFYIRGAGAAAGWMSGRDDRRLAAHQDMLCADAGEAGCELLWSPSLTTKLLETRAAGRPVVVGIPVRQGGWVQVPPASAETRLAYAEVIAHGGSPMYLGAGDGPTWPGAGEMNAFIKRHGRYLEGATSVADIAVLWSDRTADYYHALVSVTEHAPSGERHTRKQRSGDHLRALRGWFECLTRSHLQFDIADERTLEERLDRYRVLILPNAACFSQRHASAITAWVHSGGTLISTFETSFYTDWGVRRSTPALREVLGFDPSAVEGPTMWDYLDRAQDPLFDDVSSPLVPAPKYRCVVTLAGETSRAVAWYRERLPGVYHPLPPVSKHPAIVENRYGAGCSLYFAGTIDETYLDHHHPDHAALMVSRVAAATRQPLRLEATGSVQAVVRQQRSRRRLMIHLINATGEMMRPITRVTAVDRARLTAGGLKSVGSVTWLTPGDTTPRAIAARRKKDGALEVTLPRLEEYGVVVMEGVTLRDRA